MSRGLYTFELSINRVEEITVEADNLEDAKRKVDLADNEDWKLSTAKELIWFVSAHQP